MKRYRHLYQVEFDSGHNVDFSKVVFNMLNEKATSEMNITVLLVEVHDREVK